MRMNKAEVIKVLEDLKVKKEEYWLLSSSALVMRDIYPDAGDIDMAVTEEGLNELKRSYNLIQKENGWYKVSDKIECVLETKESWKYEKVGDYNVQSIDEYYKYLIGSDREKDKLRIPLVEEYIKNRF